MKVTALALPPSNRPNPQSKPEEEANPEHDVFLREVDDAVRAGDLENFWKRYGRWLAIALVVGLAAFGGWIYWQNQQTAAAEKQGEQFILAVEKLQGGNVAAAKTEWEGLSASVSKQVDTIQARIDELSKQKRLPIYGLNYKDAPEPARGWLARHGNPYQASLSDPEGSAGMDWGVYGVPETFIVDAQGVVRFKHTGPLTPEVLREQVLPLVRRLRG